MNDVTVLRNESQIVIGNGLTSFIERFTNAQDIKESSKDTYRKALRRFTVWLTEQGIHNPTR